jgi:hypothetical protein
MCNEKLKVALLMGASASSCRTLLFYLLYYECGRVSLFTHQLFLFSRTPIIIIDSVRSITWPSFP